jgi:hypothetical protein
MEIQQYITLKINHMKKMILAAFVLTTVATATYAQDAVKTAPPATGVAAQQPATTEDTKSPIEANALPPAIQQVLATDDFKEWKLVSAWQVKGSSEYYVLEMQKGEERKTLKLNKEGKAA